MKVKELTGEDYNGQGRYTLEIDGVEVLSAGCLSECPEDASLERDLNFVYNIVSWMKDAWEAGKKGDEFMVSKGTIDDS